MISSSLIFLLFGSACLALILLLAFSRSPSLPSPPLVVADSPPFLSPLVRPEGFDLCVIARSYGAQRSSWGAFVLSLSAAAQRANASALLTLVDTERDAERHARGLALLLEFAAAVRPLLPPGRLAVEVSPVGPPELAAYGRRVAADPGRPDFGYLATDVALERLLALPGEGCQYLLFTNADNLYGADLLRSTAAARGSGAALVGVFMSSRYDREAPQPWDVHERAGRNVLLRSQLKYAGVDLGAVLYRAALFREHPDLRFMNISADYWIADGQLIDKAAHLPNISTVIVEEILFMHQ